MKTLIVGAKGMLGHYLGQVYEEAGHEVHRWDYEEIDITKRDEVIEKIKELDPDFVINSAAYNAVDKAEEPEEFEKAKAVNCEGPRNLAEASKAVGATFATYSSDYVFAGDRPECYSETDSTDPINNYGISKVLGEKAVTEVGGNFFVIRTSKLFGKEGDSPQAKKSFVSIMRELGETKPEIMAVNEEMSCFTYTKDLAYATRFLLESNRDPGIYHLVNEGPYTWYGCAKKIFEILGNDKVAVKPVPASQFPRPAQRPAYSVLLNTKIQKLRPFEEALEEFLKEG